MKKLAKSLLCLLLVAAMAIPAALIVAAAPDTTVPSGLTVPDTPFGKASVKYRIGIESLDEFDAEKKIGGNSADTAVVDTNKAVFGNAVTFGCCQDGTNKAEVELYFKESFDVTGVTGVMFYVDLSNTTCAEGKAPLATVTFNTNNVRSNAKGTVGYYLKDGTWTLTAPPSGNDRMTLPVGFKGWVYIPAWAYAFTATNEPGATFDISNYSFKNLTAKSMRLYTDGYIYDKTTTATFDEILLLTSDNGYKKGAKIDDPTVPSCAPATLPNGKAFEATTRIGFDKGDFDPAALYKADKISGADNIGFVDSINGKGFGIEYASTNGQAELYFAQPISPAEAEGVLFHVDFSKSTINGTATQFGASVTFNVNDYRSNIAGGRGYYMADGATEWTETAAISACRMGVPTNFSGWIFVPADAYQQTTQKFCIANDGKFAPFAINSIRLYTTGALGAFNFDEIMFVKSVTETPDDPVEPLGDATIYAAAVAMIAVFGMGITVAVKRRHA